jgi:hypothetical protein
MGRGVDQKKLAAWRRRLARQRSSGLSVASFYRRVQVSVSLWKYWQRQVEREAPVASRMPPVRSSMPFEPVDLIPRRSVFQRFPGGATMEIPDDRIDLVRLAIDRMALQAEAEPC